MSQMQDDELTLLWRQGTSAEPDPVEIARLAGRASIRRFDRAIFWRNFGEYAAGVVLFAVFGWNLAIGRSVAFNIVAAVCVAFVLGYLWWQHRDFAPLDPSSDARVYHAAMLARIDKQVRLLGSYRFWYLMPLSLPFVWGIFQNANDDLSTIEWNLVVFAALFAGAAWLNESWGIRRLRAERARIEGLYEE